MNPQDLTLFALVLWRESRGESLRSTREACAWSIKNRVLNPGWWGHTWWTVILAPWQYSSFNHNDVNATKWPIEGDPTWLESLDIAEKVGNDLTPDPVSGATNYFDMSLDSHPPEWAAKMTHVCDMGRFHFYK